MKILDPQNAGARLKTFAFWGVILWLTEFVSSLITAETSYGRVIVAIIVICLAFLAGYMTAKALKGKTGDNNSSALYGAVPPIFAMGISIVFILLMGQPLNLSLPLIPMISGGLGGFISQRGNKK